MDIKTRLQWGVARGSASGMFDCELRNGSLLVFKYPVLFIGFRVTPERIWAASGGCLETYRWATGEEVFPQTLLALKV